jgi:hypothetical protein
VLHCRGHKGLRLLIESYPTSVKVYPQVEKIKFSPLLLKLLLLFWHNQYIFSSLKCEKKIKKKFFLRKKRKDEEIPFLSQQMTFGRFGLPW